ncbi:hypothetical protein E8E12_004417 [Didymella heteroderae]|uniref:DUF521 domain protein n=1 Tax=Didymella heteroderae TaxID=1769908 RepID=A0A9P4WIG3_9PLEO|nr:hypothetical protein E8E12_004417 [Didymella heteroderae]
MEEPSTSNLDCTVVYGTPHVHGTASGQLLASSLELSFWGGVDHESGHVIDRSHPLAGQCMKDKILAIPGGRGSCSGSATILELIVNGNGPRALVFERTNEILAVGVFVAEELFRKKIPMVIVGPKNFKTILRWNGNDVFVRDHRISIQPLEESINNIYVGFGAEHLQRHVPELSDNDRAMRAANHIDESTYTKAQGLAMDIIIRTASIMKAPSLMSVCQAHVDGAHFGPASVLFGKRLRDLGGKFAVPTTVNAITVDQQRWRDLGVDKAFGTESDELAQAFLDMGAQMSFTCAPYQLDSAPKLDVQVAFGESNVVCYANSVLGARTAKYPNMLEALIALTGRAPRAGIHLTENRVPQIAISVPPFSLSLLTETALDDSFWPLLGYEVGAKAGSLIPIITGLDQTSTAQPPSRDALKAFSAAFATSAGAPMFHILGITPEAEQHRGLADSTVLQISITWQDLQATWINFNRSHEDGLVPRGVDLISLGNPHFSLLEMRALAHLVKGRTKHPSTSVIVTTSRAQHSLATQAGYIAQLENFGVQVLTDTCWCFIRDPVIKKEVKCIMTNSGKYAHYGPGLTGREFRFGSLGKCVESACTAVWDAKMPPWLEAGVMFECKSW